MLFGVPLEMPCHAPYPHEEPNRQAALKGWKLVLDDQALHRSAEVMVLVE